MKQQVCAFALWSVFSTSLHFRIYRVMGVPYDGKEFNRVSCYGRIDRKRNFSLKG